MSIPDVDMAAPAASTIETPVLAKQPLPTEQVKAASPRLPQLDNLATSAASASSPSNLMSPADPNTESSRHSTPATSADGSDHAQSILQNNPDTSSKPSLDAEPTSEPATPALATAPAPESAPEPAPAVQQAVVQGEETPLSSPPPQPQNEEHPLASIKPAYFYPIDGSASSTHEGIPVFEPTMQQFQDFYAFCQAIDSWGMQSGIVKVVPPKEWRDLLPDLRPQDKPNSSTASTSASTADSSQPSSEQDDTADISKVRIRNAIVQHFVPGGSGVWRQTNITRTAKIWNAKQWAETCISDGQKGPEMDRMKWKVEVEGVSNGGWGPKNIGAKDSASSSILEEDGVRTRSGKARPAATVVEAKTSTKRKRADGEEETTPKPQDAQVEEPTTPAAAPTSPSSPERRSQRIIQTSPKDSPNAAAASTSRDPSPVKPKKNWEAEAITTEEWRAFDYKNCWLKEALSPKQLASLTDEHAASTSKAVDPSDASADTKGESSAPSALPSPSDWTPEVCREIESEYWRSLNFGKPPMYGADLKGTLFDNRTKHWNVGHLDNVLTRLRLKRKLPGVNTPYLYWGMWRATFAWHVEDMDLYSINYIHFGAPKQWYSIRQADRQRFESAMAGAFPSDSRRCPHFMRHKSYLASPSFLASHGIRPLKLVHNAGEFVITYPYGYHSGFNLGYNCAESVNFALESWLDIGRKANYCHCDQSQNSVHIDVDALLEESKEMEELERKRELRRAKEDAVHAVEEEELERRRIKNERAKERRRLKKEEEAAAAAANPAAPLPFQGGANFYVDPSAAGSSPCVFCPANVHTDLVPAPDEIPSTNSKLKAMAGRHAHRLCASFVPETWVGKSPKHTDIVCGIEGILPARLSLKCQICPNPLLSKAYPKIQCTRGKCPRSAHVSCALVEDHGWFVDVCPAETADRLEGKKSPSSTGEGEEERLVVLCKSHNPLFRELEEARKAEALRERIYSLPIPSMVKIRTGGGMFEALMVEINEDEDEVVIEDEGRPSIVKFGQIILDTSGDIGVVKEEPKGVNVAPDALKEDGEDAGRAGKRRRKASEKAIAAAQAASEEAANPTVDDVGPVKNATRKSRASIANKARSAAQTEEAAPPAPPAPTTAAVVAGGKAKPKRTPKKKPDPAPLEGALLPVEDAAPQHYPPQPAMIDGQGSQGYTLPPPPSHFPPAAQQQLPPPPSKRGGPRATYAAQYPHPHSQPYSHPDFGHHPQYAYPNAPPREYHDPRYYQQQQQVQRGGEGHPCPYPGESGMVGGYGHLSAPVGGFEGRSPPLPTYAKPIAHQSQPPQQQHQMADYRPPYHHMAPVHPAYQGQGGGYAYPGEPRGGYPQQRRFESQEQMDEYYRQQQELRQREIQMQQQQQMHAHYSPQAQHQAQYQQQQHYAQYYSQPHQHPQHYQQQGQGQGHYAQSPQQQQHQQSPQQQYAQQQQHQHPQHQQSSQHGQHYTVQQPQPHGQHGGERQ